MHRHRQEALRPELAMYNTTAIEKGYGQARKQYALLGVNTDWALQKLRDISISLHCWQGDDLSGFEKTGADIGGGLAVTGNYPGKARTPEELRADLQKAYSLIPGRH